MVPSSIDRVYSSIFFSLILFVRFSVVCLKVLSRQGFEQCWDWQDSQTRHLSQQGVCQTADITCTKSNPPHSFYLAEFHFLAMSLHGVVVLCIFSRVRVLCCFTLIFFTSIFNLPFHSPMWNSWLILSSQYQSTTLLSTGYKGIDRISWFPCNPSLITQIPLLNKPAIILKIPRHLS